MTVKPKQAAPAATAQNFTPVIANISEAERIPILLAAHQKHATELLAIEASQEKLNTTLLGIYSAGFALITAAVGKDAKPILQTAGHPSYLAIALVIFAAILGAYGLVMTWRRGVAREDVREGLFRIDNALAFFKPDFYLKGRPLYPDDWKTFSKKRWLNWSIAIVIIAGLAFIAAVLIVGWS